jgi:hypothetical protein
MPFQAANGNGKLPRECRYKGSSRNLFVTGSTCLLSWLVFFDKQLDADGHAWR